LAIAEEDVRTRCREAVAAGWSHFKMKVGRRSRRTTAARGARAAEIGRDRKLMMDANGRWGVDEAIDWMRDLATFDPWWIEEPTSPDDVLGHAAIARAIAPIGVATGEQCQNRVLVQAVPASAGAVVLPNRQLPARRRQRVLAVLLMAAKFDVPVCPHAGGVGLCEYVQHLAMFDYIAVSGALDDRVVSTSITCHEHFVDPVVINAVTTCATAPGYSITMKPDSLRAFAYPGGSAWKGDRERSSTPLGWPAKLRWSREDRAGSAGHRRTICRERRATVHVLDLNPSPAEAAAASHRVDVSNGPRWKARLGGILATDRWTSS
jgi:L-fuconate dehydratase